MASDGLPIEMHFMAVSCACLDYLRLWHAVNDLASAAIAMAMLMVRRSATERQFADGSSTTLLSKRDVACV